MPVQSLDHDPAGGAAFRFEDSGRFRRALVLGSTLLATLAAASVMVRLLEPGGVQVADAVLLSLFVILFAWVAFAMVSATAGFVVLWKSNEPAHLQPQPIIFTRTALLMPTYNEDPSRILAGIQAMYEDLKAKGVITLFDVFVLSDTNDETIAEAEVVGVLRLRARLGAEQRIFYRRRAKNRDRKAGNIADWVARFGSAYESMIVLDADSLMTGDTMVRLTAAMERDPKVGLIQTLPTIVGATTLFARLQQFAGRVYGPAIAQGQAWWSGSEGNYWGHNAILRTRAFAAFAGLPHIKKGHPFGGHIMSHDFVEAALLRRGGWAVRMIPGLTGSTEETPPTLIDMAVRDRRWCQGNLQHAAVLPARGLHWVSRLHLLRGVLAYLTAPLWLAFLVVGDIVWAQQRDLETRIDASLAAILFGVTMALLLAPKVMGAVLIARDRFSRRACGGAARLSLGVALESLSSALMAPVFMLMHSQAVLDVLLGRHSGWAAQRRDDAGLSFADAWRRHRVHTVLGVAWAGLAAWLDPPLLAWTCPVALGLGLSAPLSMLTSRTSLGDAGRRLGLFVTPEEAHPPAVVTRADHLRGAHQAEAAHRAQIDRLYAAAPPVPFAVPPVRPAARSKPLPRARSFPPRRPQFELSNTLIQPAE